MAVRLKLKKLDPQLKAILELRPPIRLKKFLENRSRLTLQFPMQLKQMTKEEEKAYHRERRKRIILDYAKRQEQKRKEEQKQRSVTVTDKEIEKDFEQIEIDEFQNTWVEERIRGPRSTWQRWWWSEDRPDSQVIEEWEPWNRFGEPVNIWRYYIKK